MAVTDTSCPAAFTWMTFLAANVWLGALSLRYGTHDRISEHRLTFRLQIVSSIMLIHTGEYDTKWVFIIAVCMQLVSLAVNISWGKHMNVVETISIVLHLVGILTLMALLIFARATDVVQSDFSFSSITGWTASFGVALDVVYAATVLCGFDCASHLAEDTVDPTRRVPKSLLWTTSLNKVACIVCAILVALACGDVGALFGGPLGASGHPFGAIVQLIFNAARGRKDLASAPFGLFAAILMVCSINATAAASRMAFSLIRDDRNTWVYKIMSSDLERERVPRVTIVLTALSPLVTLWINFVSSVGFQALGSQCVLSLSTTYILAISCSFYSRFYSPELLGRESAGIFQLGAQWYVSIPHSRDHANTPLLQGKSCRRHLAMLPRVYLGL